VSFQPTILKTLGYTNAEAQVHTIPVYIVALISLLICSYLSGRIGHRYGFLVFGAAVGIVGWAIELVQVKAISARYFGMFALTASAYIQMPILVVWLANNMGGNAKAAFATGFMIGVGNCGNLVSSNVFITAEMPKYKTGFSTGLGLNLLGVVASSILELYCWTSNRRRDAGKENAKLDNTTEVLRDLGDDHLDFRYIL
jgi:MFS family permease